MKTGTECLPPGAEVHQTGTVVAVHNSGMNTGGLKKKMKDPGELQQEEAGGLQVVAVQFPPVLVPLVGQLNAAIHQMKEVKAPPVE